MITLAPSKLPTGCPEMFAKVLVDKGKH